MNLLEIIKKSGKSLKELSSIMKKYPQVLINVEVDNTLKNNFYTDDYISNEIEKVSNLLGSDGRVLVRPSGTEPLIRVMIEGANKKIIDKYAKELANKIKNRLQ